jgi:molybdopterin synthase catalytic subunit
MEPVPAPWLPPGPRVAPDSRWLAGLVEGPIGLGALVDWVSVPACGAVVSFTGTTRDHSAGADGAERHGVHLLEYEAWPEQAVDRLVAVAEAVIGHWPAAGRVALVHRTGPVGLGEASVAVVVATPHRPEAFAAARYAIDAIKATVPIWKREHHRNGADWAVAATDVVSVTDLEPPMPGPSLATGPTMADTGDAGPVDGTVPQAVRSERWAT